MTPRLSQRQQIHLHDVSASQDYRSFIDHLSGHVRAAQSRAARAVNNELVLLYWKIGREILDKQKQAGWGDDVVGQIARDLSSATHNPRGFSRRNLFYMRSFARLWPDEQLVQTLSALIGWSQHQVLLNAFGDQPEIYQWYVHKSAASHWSRRTLESQINLRLHKRHGAAITNFMQVLPAGEREQALDTVKDPYIFDFLDMTQISHERHLEKALTDDILHFLIELGEGFAFYGRQRPLIVGGKEFFLDLIFYHHRLRRFVVLDLKTTEFMPEYAAKMNFYLNAVDEQLRIGDDQESVGIILCAQRNETVAKVALQRIHAPIAVSTWRSDAAALPPLEITEDISGDRELAELDAVRELLVARVAQRTAQHTQAKSVN